MTKQSAKSSFLGKLLLQTSIPTLTIIPDKPCKTEQQSVNIRISKTIKLIFAPTSGEGKKHHTYVQELYELEHTENITLISRCKATILVFCY